MAFQTFTNFTRLPPEIRRQIWQAAIRPDRPGVHYFEMRKVEDPDEDDPPQTLDIPGSELFAEEGQSVWTTNPEETSESDEPTSDFQKIQRAKASAYFWDAGLWSACSESRKTILEHVEITRFASILLNFEVDCHPDVHIRVDAREDLFVLEVARPVPNLGGWDETIRNMQHMNLDETRAQKNISPGMTYAQVAFEFDKSWLPVLLKPDESADPKSFADERIFAQPFFAFLAYAFNWNRWSSISQLWLIDRDIKRKSDSPRPPARFIGANTSYHRILANEVSSSTQRESAFRFLGWLDKLYNHQQAASDGTWSQCRRFPDVFVLECRNL